MQRRREGTSWQLLDGDVSELDRMAWLHRVAHAAARDAGGLICVEPMQLQADVTAHQTADLVVARLLNLAGLHPVDPDGDVRRVAFHPHLDGVELVDLPDAGQVRCGNALAQANTLPNQRPGGAPLYELDLIGRATLARAEKDAAVRGERELHLQIQVEILVNLVSDEQAALSEWTLRQLQVAILRHRRQAGRAVVNRTAEVPSLGGLAIEDASEPGWDLGAERAGACTEHQRQGGGGDVWSSDDMPVEHSVCSAATAAHHDP